MKRKKRFPIKVILVFVFAILISYNSVYTIEDMIHLIVIMALLSYVTLVGYKYLLDFL
jgi:hypothetical protein